jgi:DNA-binding response OmpR family regulator
MVNTDEQDRELTTPNVMTAGEDVHSAEQNSHKSRIIIVDDDEAILKCVYTFLTQEGYEVTAVSSAHEFYQHIFREPYALAILDIGLPDQDGLVLSEYARKNTDMRIIIFTGRSAIDDQLAGQKAGADLYLLKPIDFRQLSASIAALLSRMEAPSTPYQRSGEQHTLLNPEPWRLITSKWVLQSPQGQEIKLTNKELDFMTEITANPHTITSRLELLKTLGYLNNESGKHSLQSLVNRLRSKIESINTISPIQTSHGIGYTFLANITVE